MPGTHASHDEPSTEPAPAVVYPSEQREGVTVPSLGQKLPTGHTAQAAEELAPIADEYEPFVHAVPGKAKSLPSQYRPAAHGCGFLVPPDDE